MQVAFGSDYRSFYSDIPELKQEGRSELQGLLNHALDGTRMSFYYVLFKVSILRILFASTIV